jgi:hypothetical protein
MLDLPIHIGQGAPSLGQGGSFLLFLLHSLEQLLVRLEEIFLRLEELLLENRDMFPSSLRRINETRLHSGGLLQILQKT